MTKPSWVPADMGVAVAIALWLLALVPQWILMLWWVRQIDRLREAAARSAITNLLASASWIAAVLLAFTGTVLVCRDLLGSERLAIQRIIANATLVQEGLLVVVAIMLLSRRRRGGGVRTPPLQAPSLHRMWRMLLGWLAASVVLIALALGPLAGRASPDQVWGAVALAVVASVTLLVRVVVVSRRSRNRSGEIR